MTAKGWGLETKASRSVPMQKARTTLIAIQMVSVIAVEAVNITHPIQGDLSQQSSSPSPMEQIPRHLLSPLRYGSWNQMNLHSRRQYIKPPAGEPRLQMVHNGVRKLRMNANPLGQPLTKGMMRPRLHKRSVHLQFLYSKRTKEGVFRYCSGVVTGRMMRMTMQSLSCHENPDSIHVQREPRLTQC
jgi:hypothetical protein